MRQRKIPYSLLSVDSKEVSGQALSFLSPVLFLFVEIESFFTRAASQVQPARNGEFL
jgi:hypothetical protein